MTETPCTNDDCEDGWVWAQMGEFPEPCPLCNAPDELLPADDAVQG